MGAWKHVDILRLTFSRHIGLMHPTVPVLEHQHLVFVLDDFSHALKRTAVSPADQYGSFRKAVCARAVLHHLGCAHRVVGDAKPERINAGSVLRFNNLIRITIACGCRFRSRTSLHVSVKVVPFPVAVTAIIMFLPL